MPAGVVRLPQLERVSWSGFEVSQVIARARMAHPFCAPSFGCQPGRAHVRRGYSPSGPCVGQPSRELLRSLEECIGARFLRSYSLGTSKWVLVCSVDE